MQFKKLFVAGLLAGITGIASAQPQVTVYGIIDVNTESGKNKGSGANTAVGDNGLNTSRLGFRGNEDLGGGLRAEFQLESRMNPSTGVVGAGSTTTASSQFFSREAWVGLSSTKFGAIRLGTTDVTNAVNIDFIVSQAGNLGLATTQLGIDKAKTIRYSTPVFKGFSAEVGYASPDATNTNELTGNSIQSAMLRYEKGKLGVYGARENRKVDSTYTQGHTIIGTKYDFGKIRVGAYHGIKDAATLATADTGEVKQTRLSAAMPLKNQYTAHVVYVKDATASQASTDYDGYRFLLSKDFSKRTTAYAGYNMLNFVGGTADRTSYLAGLVHRF